MKFLLSIWLSFNLSVLVFEKESLGGDLECLSCINECPHSTKDLKECDNKCPRSCTPDQYTRLLSKKRNGNSLADHREGKLQVSDSEAKEIKGKLSRKSCMDCISQCPHVTKDIKECDNKCPKSCTPELYEELTKNRRSSIDRDGSNVNALSPTSMQGNSEPEVKAGKAARGGSRAAKVTAGAAIGTAAVVGGTHFVQKARAKRRYHCPNGFKLKQNKLLAGVKKKENWRCESPDGEVVEPTEQ